jgi:hypothetical protein
MPMVTFTKDNGLEIRLMVKEHILMLMVHTIMVIGSMTSNMGTEWSLGLMVLNTKVIILMEKKKERVN